MFLEALEATSIHRGTADQIADKIGILQNISESVELKAMWEKYRNQFSYAKDIKYEDILQTINDLIK